jgi:hypothetical protein
MRFLSVFLLILVGCGAMRPAHAQVIPYAGVPCPGCTTTAQLTTAAAQFFAVWGGGTPPGYAGIVTRSGCAFPRPNQFTTAVVSSTSTSLVGTYWGCFRLNKAGNAVTYPQAIATSTDPCYVATNVANVPCTAGVTNNTSFFTSQTMTLSSPTLPWQGNTIASVHAQFPVVMTWIFQNESAAQLNSQMTIIDDIQLAHFSQQLWTATNGNLASIMYWAAIKLTPANLARWSTAFGLAETEAATASYAPGNLAQVKALATGRRLIPQSHAQYESVGKTAMTINALPTGAPAPNVNMTLGEIYDEFLFNGAQSESEAVARTALFAIANVFGPGKVAIKAFAAGTAFYAFAESIDPSYGYDLTTTYGDIGASDFGPITGFSTATGDGTLGEIIVYTDWCTGVCEP